mmetsp:Transcript_38262/g.124065  ORF Transcript_38262/g.124065 Transcript_38262/m.124065 type:complete len:205 (+) Transcript_38262:363-977(+)
MSLATCFQCGMARRAMITGAGWSASTSTALACRTPRLTWQLSCSTARSPPLRRCPGYSQTSTTRRCRCCAARRTPPLEWRKSRESWPAGRTTRRLGPSWWTCSPWRWGRSARTRGFPSDVCERGSCRPSLPLRVLGSHSSGRGCSTCATATCCACSESRRRHERSTVGRGWAGDSHGRNRLVPAALIVPQKWVRVRRRTARFRL